MPMAGKLYLYRGGLSIQEIYDKLQKWTGEQWSINYEGKPVELQQDIKLDPSGAKHLTGLYSEDGLQTADFRGRIVSMPFTQQAGFRFSLIDEEPYCIILAKKAFADSVANILSSILHDEQGAVAVPVLNIRALKELYEGGETTKILLLDNIDIPNMDKATLYGGNIIQTDLYGRFINMGDPWYIVFRDGSTGFTVGIVRDGSVCIFSSVMPDEFIDYVEEKVVPLVLKRKTTLDEATEK